MISDNNIINSAFLNNSILKSDFITSILDNDFKIYGKFIRDILFEEKIWSDFYSEEPFTIAILGLEKNKEALEKSLKNIIISQIDMPNDIIRNKSKGVNYLVKIQNIQFLLHVSYFKILNTNDTISLSWDTRIIVDLDLLFLSKYSIGVFHIDNYYKYFLNNYSVISIIKNIISRKFNVVSTCITSHDLEYIKSLISLGYQNLDSKIHRCLGIYECAICYDNDDDNYCKLSCGHTFHKKCLKKAIEIKLKEPKRYYFECPYCNRKYFNYEVID